MSYDPNDPDISSSDRWFIQLKEFRENPKRGLLRFTKFIAQVFALLIVVFLIIGGLTYFLSDEENDAAEDKSTTSSRVDATPSASTTLPNLSEIDKLDCGELAEYWEGRSGVSELRFGDTGMAGHIVRIVELENVTQSGRSDNKLTCSAMFYTDRSSGLAPAKLTAEWKLGEVWHRFVGRDEGLDITKDVEGECLAGCGFSGGPATIK